VKCRAYFTGARLFTRAECDIVKVTKGAEKVNWEGAMEAAVIYDDILPAADKAVLFKSSVNALSAFAYENHLQSIKKFRK